MILEENHRSHQKHAKLSQPNLGEFGRNELSIIGTTCNNIRKLANSIIQKLSLAYKIAYVDADHKNENEPENDHSTLQNGATIEYTNKISFQRLDHKNELHSCQKRMLFNEQDLIIINGNHFAAKSQIVVIDPVKNLENKLEKLTDVKLILLKEKNSSIPDHLQKIPGFNNIPVLNLDDLNAIESFFGNFLKERKPALKGLVLSGGPSTRMKKDKGSLNYHGKNQREYVLDLLRPFTTETFVSCNQQQAKELHGVLPVIQDSFLDLGPMGGILSALQTDPNAAWLTIACDLPYLSEKTIKYLVSNRNASKVATAFLDPEGKFPEPLITIWEPKSYPVLLQFLSQGYSCPRKALINSDIQLLNAPDEKELSNVNFPDEYEKALNDLKGYS